MVGEARGRVLGGALATPTSPPACRLSGPGFSAFVLKVNTSGTVRGFFLLFLFFFFLNGKIN